jgi:L-asparaginase II
LVTNPVLVEIMRGGRVESRHRGSVAVLDAEGTAAFSLGVIDAPIYPRSAVKAIQALPLIETGAADRYGLTDAEIALACASHQGTEAHAATALSMLTKAGRGVETLECGSHWPFSSAAARQMAGRGDKPSALHNNCSGKHAGFICAACANGADPTGYVKPMHQAQMLVREAMEDVTGAAHDPDTCGTDGCSIPTYPASLRALAYGFARFGSGHGLAPQRAKAAARIREAIARSPTMLSGEGQFDTLIVQGFGARIIAKVGAEGVYCGAFPELGLGVAIKIDDGSMAAAEVVMAAMAERFLTSRSDEEDTALQPLLRRTLKNWNGLMVGAVRPAEALEQ